MPEFSMNIQTVHPEDNIANVETERAKDLLDLENEITKITTTSESSVAKIVTSDPVLTKSPDGGNKKKTKVQLMEDIRTLENKLGKENRALSRLTREDLESYISQLIEATGKEIQKEQLLQQTGTATGVIDAKTKVQQQIKAELANPMSVSEGSEFLFRFNLVTFYLLEQISTLTKDKTQMDLTGLSDKLIEDKTKILIPIYEKLFREHKVAIEKYGNPAMELLFYTITTAGSVAAANLKKTRQTK